MIGIREVIVIPVSPPFLRVLVFFALGGEEEVDGGGRFREGDVIAREDTDGLVIVLAIEIKEGDLEKMKQ